MKAYFTRRLLALLAVLILGGCATMGPPARPMPSVDEIVQLSQQGLTASEIIRRIDQSHAVYRLSASELANLRDRGVSDGVINHMNKTPRAGRRSIIRCGPGHRIGVIHIDRIRICTIRGGHKRRGGALPFP